MGIRSGFRRHFACLPLVLAGAIGGFAGSTITRFMLERKVEAPAQIADAGSPGAAPAFEPLNQQKLVCRACGHQMANTPSAKSQ